MAITHNGTLNNLPASQLPSDYVKPVVASFADYEYGIDLSLEIAKATVENADPATTMGNILDNITVGVNKQIEDYLAADFLATATVLSYASLIGLNTNFSDLAATGDYLTAAAAKYICKVKLFIKTS